MNLSDKHGLGSVKADRSPPTLALAVACAIALGAGCARTVPREEDAAVALPDAWVRVDAGRDGGRDAGRDAGPPDAYEPPDADVRTQEDETGFCRYDGTCVCSDPTWRACVYPAVSVCTNVQRSMDHCGECHRPCWRCDAPDGLCVCDTGRCAPAPLLSWWPAGMLVGDEDGPALFRSFPTDRELAVELRPTSVLRETDLGGLAIVEEGRLYFGHVRYVHGRAQLLVEEIPTDGRVVRVGRMVGRSIFVVMTEPGFSIVLMPERRPDGSLTLVRIGLMGAPLDVESVRELVTDGSAIYALLVDGRVLVSGIDPSGVVDRALSTVTWTQFPLPRPAVSIAVFEDYDGTDRSFYAALDDGTVWVAGYGSLWFDDPPRADWEPLRRVEPRVPGRVTRLIPITLSQVCMEGPDYPGGVHCGSGERFPFAAVPATAVEIDRRQDLDGVCRRYRMEDEYEEILCVRIYETLLPGLERLWTNRP